MDDTLTREEMGGMAGHENRQTAKKDMGSERDGKRGSL